MGMARLNEILKHPDQVNYLCWMIRPVRNSNIRKGPCERLY